MLQLILTNIVLNIILLTIAIMSGITFWPFETWHQFSMMTMNIIGALMLTIILHQCSPWLRFMYGLIGIGAVFCGSVAVVFCAALLVGY